MEELDDLFDKAQKLANQLSGSSPYGSAAAINVGVCHGDWIAYADWSNCYKVQSTGYHRTHIEALKTLITALDYLVGEKEMT